jgi:hypothetical protein
MKYLYKIALLTLLVPFLNTSYISVNPDFKIFFTGSEQRQNGYIPFYGQKCQRC